MSRPYEFKDRVHLQITFEFDLNLYRVDRDVYSILDWVGDMGGLNEGLYLGLKVILIFFQFSEFDHFLIQRLYSKQTENKKLKSAVFFDTRKTSWFRQRMHDLCCCFRCCIKLSRHERMFAKARLRMNNELDIVQFMKKIRRLEAWTKSLREEKANEKNEFNDPEVRQVENFVEDDDNVDYGFKRGRTMKDNVSGK